MKFKVLKGTALFDKLTHVFTEVRRVEDAAIALATELGAEKGVHRPDMWAVCFDEHPGKLWRKAFADRSEGDYMPSERTKEGKERMARIKSLPKVEYAFLNEILKYDSRSRKKDTNRISYCPTVHWHKDFILVSVREYCIYKPVEDMVELTFSEYEELKKKVYPEKKEKETA